MEGGGLTSNSQKKKTGPNETSPKKGKRKKKKTKTHLTKEGRGGGIKPQRTKRGKRFACWMEGKKDVGRTLWGEKEVDKGRAGERRGTAGTKDQTGGGKGGLLGKKKQKEKGWGQVQPNLPRK